MKITELSELESLPVGAVILAAFPAGAMEKFAHGVKGAWGGAGDHVMHPAERVPLPALILWHPDHDSRP
jgi:hypothetical protein